MSSIRLPRLLDADLREAARLTPVRLRLDQTLAPLSTAELTLPFDSPRVYVRDLVELYDEHGSAGVYRVTDVQEDVGRTRTLLLEHALATLRDGVLPAQAFTGAVCEALALLLDHQPLIRWALGDVEVPDDLTVLLSFEYTDLLTALENLLSMLPEGYALSFDQTVMPWVLHLKALSTVVECEGRLHRNLQSVRMTLDGSRLCTRLYPFGAEVEGSPISLVPLEGQSYLETADSPWGVVSRTWQSDLIYDVPTLRSVAEMYLARHSQPEITVTVSCRDLSAATLEPLDAFCTGRLCRLALPDFDIFVEARITAVSRADVYGAPGQAVLTLHSAAPDSGSAEIEELIRLVTAGKLLGGSVTETVNRNRAEGSYPSPIVHYFDVGDYAALLDVRVTFDPDPGVSVTELRIDNTYPPDSVWSGGSFSAMPYLTRDELGQIAKGQHTLVMHPSTGTYGELGPVVSIVTITTIE